jgi:hypothetical protein
LDVSGSGEDEKYFAMRYTAESFQGRTTTQRGQFRRAYKVEMVLPQGT